MAPRTKTKKISNAANDSDNKSVKKAARVTKKTVGKKTDAVANESVAENVAAIDQKRRGKASKPKEDVVEKVVDTNEKDNVPEPVTAAVDQKKRGKASKAQLKENIVEKVVDTNEKDNEPEPVTAAVDQKKRGKASKAQPKEAIVEKVVDTNEKSSYGAVVTKKKSTTVTKTTSRSTNSPKPEPVVEVNGKDDKGVNSIPKERRTKKTEEKVVAPKKASSKQAKEKDSTPVTKSESKTSKTAKKPAKAQEKTVAKDEAALAAEEKVEEETNTLDNDANASKKNKKRKVVENDVEKVVKSKRGKKTVPVPEENAVENPPNVEEVKPSRKRTEKKEKEEKPEKVDTKARKRAAVKRKSDDEEDQDVDDAKKAKATVAKKAAKPRANAVGTDYSNINFQSNEEYNLKICSWNVSGLRALVEKKNGFEYFSYEKPDIICLQEIKCLEDEVPNQAKLKGYHPYWFSKPGGRGGVGILSKIMPYNVDYGIGNKELDEEGRIITAEYEKFYLVCVYVPNAGRKLVTLPRRLRWNTLFEKHVVDLNKKKPVIICGDMNVAHTEIDLANPKTNTKNAGFTKEERSGMTDLLELGFTDTFRYLYPKTEKAYTFWTYMGNARSKNVGWRLDYCLTSTKLNSKIVDSLMRPEVLGSDHCPIILLLNL